MPNYRSRSLYVSGYYSEALLICSDCGSTVFEANKQKHNEFHEKFEELVEVMQEESEVNKKPDNWVKGKPLGLNPGLMK